MLTSQTKELEDLETQLLNIEKRYFYIIMEKDPTLLTKFNYDEIRNVFAREEIIPLESDDHRQWENLYLKYQEKRAGFVFNQVGFKPKEFNFLKMISSMFVHENFFHLLFNMIFLWLVGCNIEDDWSWKVFLGLYLVSGIVAILFHSAVYPKSDVPLIGASGAIAGVMGAFMIRHYKTKIRFAYFIWLIFRPYFGTFSIYAGVALPFWFLQRLCFSSKPLSYM